MPRKLSFDDAFRRVVQPRVSSLGAWVILAGFLGTSYLASYLLGGSESFEPLWVFVPITYAAWRFGLRATAVVVAVSAILVGPLMPADVTTGRAQDFADWGSRTFFLVLIGALMAYLFSQYRRTLVYVERERDAALTLSVARDAAADLRRAIAAGELHLHYQPIVRAGDAEIVAVEALVRWQHPARGLVSPADFIPVAEASGAIVQLDAWVAATAAGEVRKWQEIRPVRLGLNLSSTTLSDPAAVAAVETALLRSGLDLRLVDIEMTETAAGDGGIATDSLNRLASHGMRLALDDFGMGYAVLERLRAFPFSTVKIDRSFVSRVTGADRPMVEAITRMAHSMGLEVLAEGVEEIDQLQTLRGLGCDLVQGFLISRPVPPEQLQDLLRAQSGLRSETVDAVHPVLNEILRMTGLSNAYLTSIDWEGSTQEIVAVSSTGNRLVSEGLRVAWSDSLCRRALEGGPQLTADVPRDYGDSAAARVLGIQSYVTVPVLREGRIVGTLCGISRERVELAPETVLLLAGLAESLVATSSDTMPGDESLSLAL